MSDISDHCSNRDIDYLLDTGDATEISLFNIKFQHQNSKSGLPSAISAFMLNSNSNLNDDIIHDLTTCRHPSAHIWAIYKKCSATSYVYAIFTPSETIIWEPTTSRDVIKFNIGPIDRNNAILFDYGNSIAMIATSRTNNLILVPDIFYPKPQNINSKLKPRVFCPYTENNIIIIYTNDTATIYNVLDNEFKSISASLPAYYNPLRRSLIVDCIELQCVNDILYGITPKKFCVFEMESLKLLQEITLPQHPAAFSIVGNIAFILFNDRHKTAKVAKLVLDSELKIIGREKIEIDEPFYQLRIQAISPTACVVAARCRAYFLSSTELPLVLRVSDSFDNHILALSSDEEGELRILNSGEGTTSITVTEVENAIPMPELIRATLRKANRGEDVNDRLDNINATIGGFSELDVMLGGAAAPAADRLEAHHLLVKTAARYFDDFEVDKFVPVGQALRVLAIKEKDDAEGGPAFDADFVFETDMDSQKLVELTNAMRLENKNLKSAFTELPVVQAAYIRHLSGLQADNESFEALLKAFAEISDDIGARSKYVRKLFKVNPNSASSIAIQHRLYPAMASMFVRTGDSNLLKDFEAKTKGECIVPIVDCLARKSRIGELLVAGSLPNWRGCVASAVSFDQLALAFHLIQDDGNSEQLIRAAELLLQSIKTEVCSLDQLAILLGIAIFCCTAASAEREGAAPMEDHLAERKVEREKKRNERIESLRAKLEERLMMLSLQKVAGFGANAVMSGDSLFNHFLGMHQIGTTLSIVYCTRDDRSPSQNAKMIAKALQLGGPNEEFVERLLEETAVAEILNPEIYDALREFPNTEATKIATKAIDSIFKKKKGKQRVI